MKFVSFSLFNKSIKLKICLKFPQENMIKNILILGQEVKSQPKLCLNQEYSS